MKAPHWRTLVTVGVVGLLIGIIDPMEGAFIVLPFAALVAYGAFLSHSPHRARLYWFVGSMSVGVAVLIALSLIGGIGGTSGRSLWWGLLLVPYPLGWLGVLVSGVLMLREPSTESA